MTVEPMRAPRPPRPWDAIVVGGGHNGLVCAAYLARGGLRTLVLERTRHGGRRARHRGARARRARAHATPTRSGRLRGSIARDLGLAADGLRLVQPARPGHLGAAGGPGHHALGRPGRARHASLAAVSRHDADAWVAVDAEVRALSGVLSRLAAITPPDPSTPVAGDVLAALRLGLHLRGLDEAARAGPDCGCCRSRSPTSSRTGSSRTRSARCSRCGASATPRWARTPRAPRRCCSPTPRATTAARPARPCTPAAGRVRSPRRSRRPRDARAPTIRTGAQVGAVRTRDEPGHRRRARIGRGAGGTGRGQRPRPHAHAARPGRPRGARSAPRLAGGQPAAGRASPPSSTWRSRTCPGSTGLDGRRTRHSACAGASSWRRRCATWTSPRMPPSTAASATSRGWRRPSRASSIRCSWMAVPRPGSGT